jgi:hypothetical protein
VYSFCLRACFKSSFLKPAAAARQHKAGGGAESGTPGQVRSGAEPVKRAAASSAVAHFVGFEYFTTIHLGLAPQAICCRLLRRLIRER